MLDSPIDTLYHSVQKIFGPVLLKDSCWNKTVDPKLQSLLVELEAGLGSTLRKHGKFISLDSSNSTRSLEDGSLAGILTPMDEFKFWGEVGASSSRLEKKERGQYFQELLQPIANNFANIDSMPFVEALELIEITQDALDDLWKQTDHEPLYPEKRMAHLLEVVSDSIGRYVQRRLGELDVWHTAYNQVRINIQVSNVTNAILCNICVCTCVCILVCTCCTYTYVYTVRTFDIIKHARKHILNYTMQIRSCVVGWDLNISI